jgi:hypothetical protein
MYRVSYHEVACDSLPSYFVMTSQTKRGAAEREQQTPRPMPHLVPGQDADAVPGQDVPETDGAVRGARGHVVGVGVETGTGDVGQVASEHPQGLVVVRGPQAAENNTERHELPCDDEASLRRWSGLTGHREVASSIPGSS